MSLRSRSSLKREEREKEYLSPDTGSTWAAEKTISLEWQRRGEICNLRMVFKVFL